MLNQKCFLFHVLFMCSNYLICDENLSTFRRFGRKSRTKRCVKLQYHRVQNYLLYFDLYPSFWISDIIVNKYSKLYMLYYAFFPRLSVILLSISHKFFLRKNQVLPLSSPFICFDSFLFILILEVIVKTRSIAKESLAWWESYHLLTCFL